jgi:HD-like signal output (HDOD) protein
MWAFVFQEFAPKCRKRRRVEISSPETGPEPRPLLERVIAEIGTKGDFPAVARVIEQLRTTVDREHCAALDVARIVLQDAGFASKLLRLVNSAYYRRRGEPVSTITRAVMMIGFETIRDLAAALVILEELMRAGRASPHTRERLRRSLHRGLFAQRLSAHVGYSNPEEAYLLGLFADWGALWLATHYPADFERAHRLAVARDLPIEAGVYAVFGGNPADLSAAIAEAWGFPTAFATHFRNPATRDRAGLTTQEARLSAIVNLAADWTDAIDSGREPRAVLERAEALFGVPPEKLVGLARDTHDALREQAAALGLGHVPESATLGRLARGVRESAAPVAPSPSPVEASPPPPPAPAPSMQHRCLEAVADITRSIIEQRDINDILLMILESLVRVIGFDVAFLALVTVQRDRIVGRMSCGTGTDEPVAGFSVRLARGASVLADVVLERRSRVVTDGGPDMLVAPGTPPPALPMRMFMATPLVVRDQCVGVVVAGRGSDRPLTADECTLVQLLADQASVAFHYAAR